MTYQFTRHHNDIDDTKLFDNSNKNALSLIIDNSVKENQSFCYSSNGFINAQSQVSRPMKEGMLDLGSKADIESKLQNRHKELNSIERNNTDYKNVPVNTPDQCKAVENMNNEDTRFTNPIANYREMDTSQYIFNPYLFINYQQVVVDNTLFLPPTRNGDSSRYDSKKDKYKLTNTESVKKIIKSPSAYDYTQLYSGLLPQKLQSTPAYMVGK